MHGTVKIAGGLAERVRTLLGGSNPTPKRVEALLSELEERRGLSMVDRSVDPPPVPGEEPQMESVAPVGVAVAPVLAPASPANWDEEKRLLYETIRSLEGKIEELRKPAGPKEREEAIATGKLPPPNRVAPESGTPRRQLGPKVFVKLCECGRCTDSRRYHWFCCICRSGPHHYQQRYPHFTKNWYEPGSVRGISHHACSEPCRMQYLAKLGVTPGLNDVEPPMAAAQVGSEPVQPRTAYDSD